MTSSDKKFQSEVVELCTEILNSGVLPPLIVLGWGGALLAQFEYRFFNAEGSAAYLVLLGLGGCCLLLNHFRRFRLSLWLAGWGSLGLTLAVFYTTHEAYMVQWIAIACVVIIFFSGSPAGWAAIIATAGVTAWIAFTQPGPYLQPGNLAQVLLPLFTLALLATVVSRVLYRTLKWMSEGYEQARQHSELASRQSAELALALKSLNQTSFALARANEQLRAMVTVAEDARRSKQEFAASISHELRMPLNLIIGFSDVILNAPSTYNTRRLPPKLLADIHVIQRNAQHLMKLVNDVLDLSQMDVSHMTIIREPIDVDEFIQSSLGDFAQLVDMRGLWLELDIEPGLPQIHADRTRIQQILLNLLNNALRFTEQGRITIRVRHRVMNVQGQEPSDDIIFSVSDTGVGISPENLKRIFEPFTQADNAIQRKHGGTGLGLTISKRFVELHGGQMWAESTPGVGSTFYFLLPAQPPAAISHAEYTPQQVHRREVGSLFVVEPRPLLFRLLERRIQGIRLTHARTMEEVMEQTLSECPEAVLINHPSGAQTQFQCQEELKHVPIFHCYIPSNLRSGQMDTTKPGIVRCFLVKPVLREQLYEALVDILAPTAPGAIHTGKAGGTPYADTDTSPHSARILVMEGDDDTLQLIDRMLRSAPKAVLQDYSDIIPLKVRTAEQAIEALRHYDRHPFQGAILDLGSNTPNGLDVLYEMERQEHLRAVPVCVISGQEPSGAVMTSPYLALTRLDGLTTQELAQSVATLMQIVVPGVELSVQ
ncbi:MAG: hybrid sensor histidine kinase/response regulator [Chloroflexi bacterium]|nr:hybrid sensor histidine kinase/response regulator [Chloroflexota bacterium]